MSGIPTLKPRTYTKHYRCTSEGVARNSFLLPTKELRVFFPDRFHSIRLSFLKCHQVNEFFSKVGDFQYKKVAHFCGYLAQIGVSGNLVMLMQNRRFFGFLKQFFKNILKNQQFH